MFNNVNDIVAKKELPGSLQIVITIVHEIEFIVKPENLSQTRHQNRISN